MGGKYASVAKYKAYQHDYYQRNRDKLLAKARSRRQTPENQEKMRDYLRKRTFGVTADQYRAWTNEQEGLCAVCHQPPTGRGLCVDHDHRSERIRGLLCTNCNLALGHTKDNPAILRGLAEYLEVR